MLKEKRFLSWIKEKIRIAIYQLLSELLRLEIQYWSEKKQEREKSNQMRIMMVSSFFRFNSSFTFLIWNSRTTSTNVCTQFTMKKTDMLTSMMQQESSSRPQYVQHYCVSYMGTAIQTYLLTSASNPRTRLGSMKNRPALSNRLLSYSYPSLLY